MPLTRNVMQLNNISVGTGKKITFEDIVFSGQFFEGTNAAYYNPDNPRQSSNFAKYWKAYVPEIDIADRYSQGAKYLYVLAPIYHERNLGVYQGGNIGPVSWKNISGQSIQDANIGEAYVGNLDTLVSSGKAIITSNERIANAVQPTETNVFDLVSCEFIYDIKHWIDLNAKGLRLGTTMAGTHTIPTDYNVTITQSMCQLEAYFIYET